jgi:hypothetical protein
VAQQIDLLEGQLGLISAPMLGPGLLDVKDFVENIFEVQGLIQCLLVGTSSTPLE